MKKKAIHGLLFVALCLCLLLGFRTNAKAAVGNYYIKINKGTNVVTVYTHDNKPYTAFVCSAGYATPVGTFYTQQKYTWWTLDGPCYGQYCTRITGSILFHSVWYYQQNKTTQSYVQYNRLGTLASHGCVRLTTAASKWIYENCPLSTKVIIFNGSSSDDPLGKPDFIRVSTAVSRGWDPTDPDPNNPYRTKNTQPKITVKSKTVKAQYRGKFEPVEMAAYDSAGNRLSSAWIRSSGTVNTYRMGKYYVTYSLTDSFGRNASTTVAYIVGDASKPALSGVKDQITKEYNSVITVLAGVKAKTSLGASLTDRIVTSVKKPGTKTFVRTSDTLKLRQTGTYKLMYYVKNPANNLAVKKYTKIIVKDTKKPVIKSKNNFAPIKLKAGTKSVTFKQLRSGITAQLLSGKSMTSKISIKVTGVAGKVKTVKKDGSYSLGKAGTYKVAYYCMNPNRNLKSGQYKVAVKTRKLVLEEVKVKSVSHVIKAPADKVVTTTGSAITVLENVKVVTTKKMTDQTQKVTSTKKGITYSVTYQAFGSSQKTACAVKNGKLQLSEEGTYRITYSYTDANGKAAKKYVRTLTVRKKKTSK